MSASIRVKSRSPEIRAPQEATARAVLAEFDGRLPERLLCFLDDQDCIDFRRVIGAANRGFYAPVKFGKANFRNFWSDWPDYLQNCVLVLDEVSLSSKQAFDHVVYLHGSTCETEIGLTMCLAHELQHAAQGKRFHKVWASNGLIQHLPSWVIASLKLQWPDIPIERDSRIVAKRVAEKLFGTDSVRAFVESKISNPVDENDKRDWEFIARVDASIPYDLEEGSRDLFARLRPYRSGYESLLEEVEGDPDFQSVDVHELFGGAG